MILLACGVCRVGSPSPCSGSSWRSSTWPIQAPWPFCWRMRKACTTTTSASHKDPPTSPCSGTLPVLHRFSICASVVCASLKKTVWVFYRRFSVGAREKVLRWLFPKAELCPLLDSAGTILQRCLVTHNTNSQSKVSAHVQTSSYQSKFGFWIQRFMPSWPCLTHVVCLRVLECLAGWWWGRGFRQFEFCLFVIARSTAAPSTCGWRLETWVTPAAPDFIHKLLPCANGTKIWSSLDTHTHTLNPNLQFESLDTVCPLTAVIQTTECS